MIPLCKALVGTEELNAVKEVMLSGWLTHGPKNKEFENNFAQYLGVKNAITLNSCASALFLVLKALGIKGEVIIPSFTFSATANAVVTAGAKPVFADVIWETGNIDPEDVENRITNSTEAVMPVHFAGQSCQIEQIKALADKYNLALIEDSAEAIGAGFKGQYTGSFGIGCFSFFPTKNVTTGEGGMVTTNDNSLAEKIRILCAHGIPKHKKKEDKFWCRSAITAGYNMRMSNILAAIGVEQLKKLDYCNNLRIQHTQYLNNNLKGVVEIPIEDKNCKHVYQMYTIRIENNRDEIVYKLKDAGIEASVHFDPPVHLQDYYRERYSAELPVTEKLSQSIITLPMYPTLKTEDLDYIIKNLKKILLER